MDPRRDWFAVLVSVAIGAMFVTVWQLTAHPWGAFDIYMHYMPNLLYATRQLANGGSGLLWNPFQNCGQPFFGNSSTGLLYPPYWAFIFLDSQRALWAVTVSNLSIAGIGAFALARELGASRAAALCAAVAFALGNGTIDVNTWSPMVGSPYVWLPAALYCCERALRDPTIRRSLALALVLLLAWLPGFPQIVFIGYQLIGLRVVWELATRRVARRFATLIAIGGALALAPLLAAVYLIPGFEMAAASVRNRELTLVELLSESAMSWSAVRDLLGTRNSMFNPFTFLPFVLAVAALFQSAVRRIVLFYFLAGVLYFVLSFGPKTVLFEWYLSLPLTRTFRSPARLLWATSFCLAVLTAIGADAITSPNVRTTRLGRLGPLGSLLAAAVCFHFMSASGVWRLDLVSLAVALAGAALAMARPTRAWGTGVVAAAVTVSLLAFDLPSFPRPLRAWAARAVPGRTLVPTPTILQTHAPLFAQLRELLTAQERVSITYTPRKYDLMPKTACLFGVPAIHDYEPAPTQRSAEYTTMMRRGQPMTNLNSFYYGGGLASPVPGPLLNLAAARYLVVDDLAPEAQSIAARFQPVLWHANVTVYENPAALPRAFYVPRLQVMPNPQALLQRLAKGGDNPHQVALVESVPPSGFLGLADAGAGGTVEFVTSDPERVVLRVEAPQRGFLHLADQHFPGWYATVNGASTPILRANFLFRAVEVPAGASVVEFRYTPNSLRLGVFISALSVIGFGAMLSIAIRRMPRVSHADSGRAG